jgi:YD repeat-containing protein
MVQHNLNMRPIINKRRLWRLNTLINENDEHYQFQYDAAYRLIGKYTTDGTPAYQYDKADNLIKVGYKKAGLPAEAEPDLIAFSYDLLSNLLSETTAQGTLSHQYDPLGNRIATTLPDGITINSLYIYTDQNSYEPLARIDKRGMTLKKSCISTPI